MTHVAPNGHKEDDNCSNCISAEWIRIYKNAWHFVCATVRG
jgi:hypothetical protein